ncbi:hypothetical protein GCM10017576_23470 [Microbacterium barkeri]|uniref:Ig-like domain-containing protein n=1 Tax=Microbacterium barkeri TaxID=33917 RepID=A0A9W6LX89_9MICO|nr:hypothetical protein [Microbacterium barkeri]MDI6944204.1 hypothetical protein [Microbacterium barkeri]MDR6876776.1 hypothetical protein [Microbacterium barkeri]GLJ62217.1 hypothetical protein GCM10017576_23470 [Microbacterium barkeri]
MRKNTNRRNLLVVSAVALGLSLIAAPLIGNGANAALDDGGFCIQAKGFQGEFTGMAGAKSCGTAEQPEEPEIPEPIVASSACSLSSASHIRFRWSVDTSLNGAAEHGVLVDGKIQELPGSITATTTGGPSGYTTDFTGSSVIPLGSSATYAVRFASGEHASKWVLYKTQRSLVGGISTCVYAGLM